MATLAIKGHPKRGNEVIEILEMLGGRNLSLLFGDSALYYAINREGIISTHCEEQVIQFSLEEFLEKFPYKVGDKILFKTYGIYTKIKTMLWNVEKERVFYRLESNKLFVATADELQPRKEETTDKTNKAVFDYNAQCCDIMNHLIKEETMEEKLEQITFDIPDGYEFFGINDDNQVVLAKKQPQYPKTYIECAKSLECFGAAHIDGYKCELLEKLQELLICRDAYWKIAGDWNPDWANANERKYCIVNTEGNITKWVLKTTNKILAFPTEEMRDAFYENFKDLIEQCNELL